MGFLRKLIKNVLPYYLVKKYQKRTLEKAAEIAVEECRNNKELTAFTNAVSCQIMMALDKGRQNFVFEGDYIRNSSLELIANEIYDKKIYGSIAELVVYRGDFAKHINIAFPDKKCTCLTLLKDLMKKT